MCYGSNRAKKNEHRNFATMLCTDQLFAALTARDLSLLLRGPPHSFLGMETMKTIIIFGTKIVRIVKTSFLYLGCASRAIVPAWWQIPFTFHNLLTKIARNFFWVGLNVLMATLLLLNQLAVRLLHVVIQRLPVTELSRALVARQLGHWGQSCCALSAVLPEVLLGTRWWTKTNFP